MSLKKLDHINIVVSDLRKAQSFFSLLGFQSTEPAELSGDWISSIVRLNDVVATYVVLSHPASSTNIELISYSHPPSSKSANLSNANEMGFRHIALEVDDIEEEVARLVPHGIEFLSRIHVYEKTGKKLVYFYGPDGILLELAEYPKKGI